MMNMAVMWKNERGETCFGVNPAEKKAKSQQKAEAPKPKKPEAKNGAIAH